MSDGFTTEEKRNWIAEVQDYDSFGRFTILHPEEERVYERILDKELADYPPPAPPLPLTYPRCVFPHRPLRF